MESDAEDVVMLEIIQHTEQAKLKMELLRNPAFAEQYDGRALSIAVTHLETAQLWTANARRG
jgi:hypothetical protein